MEHWLHVPPAELGKSMAQNWHLDTSLLDQAHRFLRIDARAHRKDKCLRSVQYLSFLSANRKVTQVIGLGRLSARLFLLVQLAHEMLHRRDSDPVLRWIAQAKSASDLASLGMEHAHWICSVLPHVGRSTVALSLRALVVGLLGLLRQRRRWRPLRGPTTAAASMGPALRGASLTDRTGRWSAQLWFVYALVSLCETVYTWSKDLTSCMHTAQSASCDDTKMAVLAGLSEVLVSFHFSTIRSGVGAGEGASADAGLGGRPPPAPPPAVLGKTAVGLLGLVYPLVQMRHEWKAAAAGAASRAADDVQEEAVGPCNS